MLLTYSANKNPKRTKFLFENFLVNAGGMIMLLISTLKHFDIYCLAEMSFDNFLAAIDSVKVYTVYAYLYWFSLILNYLFLI